MPSLQEIYETCGQENGLEIWRVEDFELVKVAEKFHGQFFTGDSYVALYTYEEENPEDGTKEKAQNLHFWIGSESSQDEYGAAAIIVTQMDTVAGDLPVQYRETEGHESQTFREYFRKIEYKAGGVASGFTHCEVNEDNNQRLLRVKGKGAKVACKEVEFSYDSFTTDDVYIIEIGSDIYRWKGAKASMFEWLESQHVANEIRDNDQAGRGEIHEIEEMPGYMPIPVKEALGGDPPSEFPESGATSATTEEAVDAKLYKVSNDSGELEVTEVATAPGIAVDIMETDDCYVLDCSSSGNIFVWKGKTAAGEEKNKAMKTAVGFLQKHKDGSKHVSIQVFPQGAEPALFKDQFENWVGN